MDREPVKTAIRLLRKPEKKSIGICTFCGCKGPIELHHVNCRNHDSELLIPVCPDCHALYTEGQLQERVGMRFEPDRIGRAARIAEAQAAFFEKLATGQEQLAERQRLQAAFFKDFAEGQRRLANLLRGGSEK
jgi:hypothetical protein